MRPVRLRYTYELLRGYDAFDSEDSLLVDPRSATAEELQWLHTPDYVEMVRRLSAGEGTQEAHRYNFSLQGDNPYYPGMFEAATLSSGATLLAAEMVANKTVDVAFNISGGLHHAAAGHASGFCVFNDPALAVHHFLRRGMRVAYIDVDAHHGDGVQEAFYDDDRVLTISVHESGRYLFPGTGFVGELGQGRARGYSVNLPLFPYTSDDVYLDAFRQVVPPLIRAFGPDVLVTQLGIDSYHSDPLTHLQLTTMGFVEVVREFAALGLPWLATGGGGYDLMAVARAWTLAYGEMLGVEWPDTLPRTFAVEHGIGHLRDSDSPEVPANLRPDIRRHAGETVAALKEQVFPILGVEG
jgi:acetoin utilization protein AcuC